MTVLLILAIWLLLSIPVAILFGHICKTGNS